MRRKITSGFLAVLIFLSVIIISPYIEPVKGGSAQFLNEDVPANKYPIGEAGKITLTSTIDDGETFETINFDNRYENPVVVAYIMSRNGGQSVEVRVREVTETSCEIFMHEPDNQGHNSEEIGYIIMEEGMHQLEDGTWVEAGKFSTTSTHVGGLDYGGINVNLHTFESKPVILHTLNTHNNRNNQYDFVTSCLHSTSSSGFKAQLEIAETPTIISEEETIGWIAIESGINNDINGVNMKTGIVTADDNTFDGIDDIGDGDLTLFYNYDNKPIGIIKGIYQRIDRDGFWSRGSGIYSNTGMSICAEEDQCEDSERSHSSEGFDYWIIESATTLLGDVDVWCHSYEEITLYSKNKTDFGESSAIKDNEIQLMVKPHTVHNDSLEQITKIFVTAVVHSNVSKKINQFELQHDFKAPYRINLKATLSKVHSDSITHLQNGYNSGVNVTGSGMRGSNVNTSNDKGDFLRGLPKLGAELLIGTYIPYAGIPIAVGEYIYQNTRNESVDEVIPDTSLTGNGDLTSKFNAANNYTLNGSESVQNPDGTYSTKYTGDSFYSCSTRFEWSLPKDILETYTIKFTGTVIMGDWSGNSEQGEPQDGTQKGASASVGVTIRNGRIKSGSDDCYIKLYDEDDILVNDGDTLDTVNYGGNSVILKTKIGIDTVNGPNVTVHIDWHDPKQETGDTNTSEGNRKYDGQLSFSHKYKQDPSGEMTPYDVCDIVITLKSGEGFGKWSWVKTYTITIENSDQAPNADFSWSPTNPYVGEKVNFDSSLSSDPDTGNAYPDFTYKREISVTNGDATAHNGNQILVEIDTATLIDNNKMNIDCSDVRFADENGNELSYWVNPLTTDRSSTDFRINCDVPSSGTNIYMYYGNSDASSNSDSNIFLGYHWEDIQSDGAYSDTGTLKTFTGITVSQQVSIKYRYCYNAGTHGRTAHIYTDFDGVQQDDNSFSMSNPSDYSDYTQYNVHSFYDHTDISNDVEFRYKNGDWRVRIACMRIIKCDESISTSVGNELSNGGDDSIVSYHWDFDDGSTSTAANPTHTFNSDGNYDVTLTVTDSYGLEGSKTYDIDVQSNSKPTCDITYSTYPLVGAQVQYYSNANDPDGYISSYRWDFGDGTVKYSANPTHTYTSAGSYKIELRVTDNSGANGYDEVWVHVDDEIGCPYVSPWNGTDYEHDNNLLGKSEFEDGEVEDSYILSNELIEKNGTYSLRIDEFENSEDFLDQVKLYTVDYNEDYNLATTPEGEILAYENPTSPTEAVTNTSLNVLPQVQTKDDSESLETQAGGIYKFTFEEFELSKVNDYKLVMNSAGFDSYTDIEETETTQSTSFTTMSTVGTNAIKTSLYVSVRIGESDWENVTIVHPRVNPSDTVIPLRDALITIHDQYSEEELGDKMIKVKILSTKQHWIDFIGLDDTKRNAIVQQEADLLEAAHSDGSVVTYDLLYDDNVNVTIIPGEYVRFDFSIPEQTFDYRDILICVKGSYRVYNG